MDGQNNPQQQQQQQPVVPSAPDSRSHMPIMVLIGLVMLGIGLGGGYFLFANKSQQAPQLPTQQVSQISPTEIVVVSPTSVLDSAIPSDWVKKISSACNVTVPVPPKEAPYYIPQNPNTPAGVNDEGSYWGYQEIKNTQSESPLFTHSVYVTFTDPEAGGSGYIGGGVFIECAPNASKYTTQTFFESYEKKFTDGTFSGINIAKKENTTMWNREMVSVLISGGMYDATEPEYLFATSSHIYKVQKVSMSTNQNVKETTLQIFTNLQFKD